MTSVAVTLEVGCRVVGRLVVVVDDRAVVLVVLVVRAGAPAFGLFDETRK